MLSGWGGGGAEWGASIPEEQLQQDTKPMTQRESSLENARTSPSCPARRSPSRCLSRTAFSHVLRCQPHWHVRLLERRCVLRPLAPP